MESFSQYGLPDVAVIVGVVITFIVIEFELIEVVPQAPAPGNTEREITSLFCKVVVE